MEARILAVKLLKPNAKEPEKAHDSDAGYDIYAPEDIRILAGEFKKISTGIAIQLPHGFHVELKDKSSRASQGLHVMGGIIDQDYRGEIIVVMHNLRQITQVIKKGEKICQMILYQDYPAVVFEVDDISETDRGEGGFGSTGL
ncbi:MAG: dUTP diphosphatase [Calditrichaeota bacterium]|nr:MAG: dUTP diphosphatase [Calditrichota bacterium]